MQQVVIFYFFIRVWQDVGALLSVYYCVFSLALDVFIAPQAVSVVVINNLVNLFFIIDIYLQYRVTDYFDTYTTVKHFVSVLRVSLLVPYDVIAMFLHPFTQDYYIATLFQFVRIFYVVKIHYWFRR
jgi:hypothetical protein